MLKVFIFFFNRWLSSDFLKDLTLLTLHKIKNLLIKALYLDSNIYIYIYILRNLTKFNLTSCCFKLKKCDFIFA